MASKQQAEAALKARGFCLDPDSEWTRAQGGWAIIDAIGHNTIDGECRGHVVFDYTASASQFWQEVIDTAAGLPAPTPCPCAAGECDFHDEMEA